ncbi:Beta-barrel assembly-enhancing protease [Acidithiobacillus ferridurans]|uniref:Beta-barrel assembly-enhancing protease n=5 Tax=Acidithiobacillus TaxID=119977 RepID=A0A2Z6IHG0_ACIFI|nr:Beta-barrel assembly-enhancing protease [Acidithiobacillus ferridurans]
MVAYMSLIHDVLSDLDRRQTRKSAGPEMPVALLPRRSGIRPRLGVLLLLGGGFLAVSAVFWWFYLPASSETVVRKAPVRTMPAPVAVVPTAAAPRDQTMAPTRSSALPAGALLHAPSRTEYHHPIQREALSPALDRTPEFAIPKRYTRAAKVLSGNRVPLTRPQHQVARSDAISDSIVWEDEKLRLAERLWQRGETAEALELLRQSLRRSPNNVSLTLLEARLLAAQQQPAQALSLLRDLQPAPTDNADYFGMLGTLAQQQGDLPLAENAYARALTLAPDSLRWKTGMGITLALAGNNAARPYLEEALASTQPTSPLAGYLRTLLDTLH